MMLQIVEVLERRLYQVNSRLYLIYNYCNMYRCHCGQAGCVVKKPVLCRMPHNFCNEGNPAQSLIVKLMLLGPVLLTRQAPKQTRHKRSPHLPSPGAPRSQGPKVSPESRAKEPRMAAETTKTAGMFRANFHRFHRLVLLRRRPIERNFSLESQ